MYEYFDQRLWDMVHSRVWYHAHDNIRIPVFDRVWAIYDEIYDSLGEEDDS